MKVANTIQEKTKARQSDNDNLFGTKLDSASLTEIAREVVSRDAVRKYGGGGVGAAAVGYVGYKFWRGDWSISNPFSDEENNNDNDKQAA